MNDSNNSKIDLNRSELKELINIPGVGNALAERIIEGRPYASAEDLSGVRGIGPAFYERIRPFITVQNNQESTPDDSSNRADADQQHPSAGIESSDVSSTIQSPEGVTRGEALWLAGGSALISIVITLVLTLGVLGVINGGLRFTRLGEFAELNRQADTLASDLAFMEGEVSDLRTRLDTLETLSGRMTAIENDLETIESASTAAIEQVAEMEAEFATLSTDLEEIQAEISVFQNFLDGLRTLLMQNPASGGIPNDN
ncbi:MAG: hypothetical protein DWQ07_17005 [Chloroflexi bacterium]|nr:MAG: hypothetical protein DWQ07_17005 [Chloroflexota bacterium]MBL1195104.1 hypothetical protein [Chloroflexota bacterium]NOH12390.1 hypothetical protein [Chloroflexota bacterium]